MPAAPSQGPSLKAAIAACIVAIAVGLGAVWNPPGAAREFLFALFAAFLGLTLAESIEWIRVITGRVATAPVFRYGIAVCTSAAITLGIVRSYQSAFCTVPPIPQYPCVTAQSATVSDFAGPDGVPALTCMGTPWSMFSDNDGNMPSKIEYSRSNETDADGRVRGFMRITFQLQSSSGHEPFVGVFSDLSFPPARPYDFSSYDTFAIRVRMGQPLEQAAVLVSVVLYSDNITGPSYVFPRITTRPSEMTQGWVELVRPLSAFGYLAGLPHGAELDPHRIYRIGIMITGKGGHDTHGHIDVTDLQFRHM